MFWLDTSAGEDAVLLITRQARPTRADLPPLQFVALGVVTNCSRGIKMGAADYTGSARAKHYAFCSDAVASAMPRPNRIVPIARSMMWRAISCASSRECIW